MKAGKLNVLVTIRQKTSTQDEAGQPVLTYSNLATVWANIRHLSGVETIKSEAPTSVVKASIRIRRRTDVTAAMEVVHGATIYEIKAVLPDEESRERLDLACEVVTESA